MNERKRVQLEGERGSGSGSGSRGVRTALTRLAADGRHGEGRGARRGARGVARRTPRPRRKNNALRGAAAPPADREGAPLGGVRREGCRSRRRRRPVV